MKVKDLLVNIDSEALFEFFESDVPFKKRRKKKRGGFLTMYKMIASVMGADLSANKLTAQSYRLFFYLIWHMKYGGEIPLTQAEVARDFGISQSRCSLAFGQLVEAGVLLKNRKIGRGYAYCFHPRYVWMGSNSDRDKALDQLTERFVKQKRIANEK